MKNKILTAWLVLIAVFIAYLVIAIFSGSGAGIIVRDVFYELMGFLTVSILVFTAYKIGARDRRLWTYVAAAGVFWMVGDITYRGAEILGVAGADRLLAPPDLFYLLSYASLICAVQAFARISDRRVTVRGVDWVKFYTPGVTGLSFIMSGVLALFMPNGIGMSGYSPSSLTISMMVNYMYPALDIGILAGLLLIILTQKIPFRKAWQGIGVFGLALFTLADMNYSLAEPAGIYSPENIVSRMIIALWILGDILIIMSSVYRLTEESERLAVGSEVADDPLLVSD